MSYKISVMFVVITMVYSYLVIIEFWHYVIESLRRYDFFFCRQMFNFCACRFFVLSFLPQIFSFLELPKPPLSALCNI